MTDTSGPIRCGGCSESWTGLSRAHCAACHRTFSTDSAADKHRTGKFGADRRCVYPADCGLVAAEKSYGILWQYPGPSEEAKRKLRR